MQSFTLVYTAGAFGIDDTGSIKIGFRFATDFGPVQFTDPEGAGLHHSRSLQRGDARGQVGVQAQYPPLEPLALYRRGEGFSRRRRHHHHPLRRPAPRARPASACRPIARATFEFRVFADPIATYDYVALPRSPKIAIVAGPGVRWRAVLPTLVRAGEPFRLSIKADDKWGNPSDSIDRTLRLESDGAIAGLPPTVRFAPGAFAAVVDGLRVDESGDVVDPRAR